MSDGRIFHQNTFSRSLINEAKLGAYYTEVGHCERIGRLLNFPDSEVCALEPSIGNGAAILASLENCQDARIYGVELNRDTFEQLQTEHDDIYVVNADFLNGVKISNKAFSYCFSNPPYGVTEDEKSERLEKLFMEKIFNYMTPLGILVYVIPLPVLQDEKFLKPFMARFNPLSVYRFDDDEYEKFHQCVVISQRRSSIGFMREWLDLFWEKIADKQLIPYLPRMEDEVVEKIDVPPSKEENIQYFTTLVFDAEVAKTHLNASNLYTVMTDKMFVAPYLATSLGQPPTELRKDLLYLCAIGGGGQGLTGSEENHDLHLQRGVAKVITDAAVEVTERGDQILRETSHTKVVLNIIENDGKITTLE